MPNIVFRPATRADIGHLQAIFMGRSGFNHINFSAIGQFASRHVNLVGTKNGGICGFIQAKAGFGADANVLEIAPPIITYSAVNSLERELTEEASHNRQLQNTDLPTQTHEDAYSFLRNEFINATLAAAISNIQGLEFYQVGMSSLQEINPLQQFLSPADSVSADENAKNLKNPIATQHEPVVS